MITSAKRLKSVLTLVIIAITAISGLLLIMDRLAASETAGTGANNTTRATEATVSERADGSPLPAAPEETAILPADIVATVKPQNCIDCDEIITRQAWQQATRLDAVMSQLAGQPVPTAEETLDRLVNEIIVLAETAPISPAAPGAVEDRLLALEKSWRVPDETVVSTLAKTGLTRVDLTDRVARLLQVEAALKQLGTRESDLNAWLAQARGAAQIGLNRSLVDPSPAVAQVPPTEPEPEPSAPAVSNIQDIAAAEPSPAPYPESTAPDFSLTQLDNQPITLGDFSGKPALINFGQAGVRLVEKNCRRCKPLTKLTAIRSALWPLT